VELTQKQIDEQAEALATFAAIQAAVRDERLQCLKDRRFYSIAGAQWEGPLQDQFASKPRFEVNKIHLAIIRIINEYRNNRITCDFLSRSGDEDLADDLTALFRADEQDSNAQEAYDNAFEEAVGGGIGAWRLRARYEDDEDPFNDYQRIAWEPIFDADSCVFFGLNCKRQDKADAKECFVLTPMARQAYINEYNDDPATWPQEITQSYFDWATPDVVYVAEHYKIKERWETAYQYVGVDSKKRIYTKTDFENDPDLQRRIEAMGSRRVGEKQFKTREVHKYIRSGGRLLEDCGVIAGKCIPVIMTFGKRWVVDNVERCMGQVRLPMDAQRLSNMQKSLLAELSALTPMQKPILHPEEVAGHQVMWAEDNVKNNPYLLRNPLTDANGQPVYGAPIQYTQPAQIPPSLAALVQLTDQDMRDLLGNAEQGDKMVSNIASKTVEMIQERLDMQTYIYVSNFAKALKRCGEVWLSMAKDLYTDEGRKMKTVAADGAMGSIELLEPLKDKGGAVRKRLDMSTAMMDVVTDIGPTSQSKRQATVRSLTNMLAMTADPETQTVLTATIMANIEGEGTKDLADFYRRKLIKMGAIKPTEDEAKALAAEPKQPDPNAVFLQAAAEEATAKASQARATVVKTIADSELSRAKTVETLANVDIDSQDHAMRMASELGGMVLDQAAMPGSGAVVEAPSTQR
jgi:hypothetical protein